MSNIPMIWLITGWLKSFKDEKLKKILNLTKKQFMKNKMSGDPDLGKTFSWLYMYVKLSQC